MTEGLYICEAALLSHKGHSINIHSDRFVKVSHQYDVGFGLYIGSEERREVSYKLSAWIGIVDAFESEQRGLLGVGCETSCAAAALWDCAAVRCGT